jgi:uncharacterized protein
LVDLGKKIDPVYIRPNEIPKEGLTLRCDLPAIQMDLNSTGVELKNIISVDLAIEKFQELVTIEGEIFTTLFLECGRCLSEFTQPLKVAIHSQFLSDGEGQTEDESYDGSLEIHFYSGETIDLESLIRENVILALPFRPLCRESCLGLCNRCGSNLNNGPCGCEAEKPLGPFSILQDYFS